MKVTYSPEYEYDGYGRPTPGCAFRPSGKHFIAASGLTTEQLERVKDVLRDFKVESMQQSPQGRPVFSEIVKDLHNDIACANKPEDNDDDIPF